MKKIKATLSMAAVAVSLLIFGACSNGGSDAIAKYESLAKEVEQLRLSNQKLADEMAIRELAHKFSDAANRKDGDLFQSLWAKDGVWKIGPPINVEFKGKENMGPSVTRMLGLWDFFVQMTGPGVVTIDGNTAKARFYVNEVARATADKHGNYNLSMYADELVKEDGQWYFTKRTYHTIYQEAPDYKGQVFDLPATPK